MKDTQSQTESLLDIVKGIDESSTMLPEFQRDFRWELNQTCDLFDSLIRDIFIGTIIYGKPSFGMTLREIDNRPRKGAGSRAALKTIDYSTDKIKELAQTKNFRIVLDGQQRITSIYRALKGRDSIYLIIKDLDAQNIGQHTLEEMIEEVSTDESSDAVSVKLLDAYEAEINSFDDEELNERFLKTKYVRTNPNMQDEEQRKNAAKVYRRVTRKLIDLYKQQKMVAFYQLDMGLEKFCLFFERSNSRGIQLNFTDILAAKLYNGFNLRKEAEAFESQSDFELNREIIIRAIAYVVGSEQEGLTRISKEFILNFLGASEFNKHWEPMCKLYTECLQYLNDQHYILSQKWMPTENMLIPLMMFLRQIKSFDRMDEEQRQFIEYWYWSSVFSNRYSSASNEVIILDSETLTQIAKNEPIGVLGYFSKLRPLITEPKDLFTYTRRTSATYKGVLNMVAYDAKGLMDWSSHQSINMKMQLDDHHIFPRAYILSKPKLDTSASEAEQLVDCVVNRTLIPKILNIKIGKKAPNLYLSELKQSNAKLAECLTSHLISDELVTDDSQSYQFKSFLEKRSEEILAIIQRYAVSPSGEMERRYSSEPKTLA